MIDTALKTLKKGKLVALPTDTVYGVVADASNNDAIDEFYKFKSRPQTQPSQILVSSYEMAEQLAEFSPEAKIVAQKFWPGALTIILPFKKSAPISKLVCGNSSNIGIRMPNNKLIKDIINKLNIPLVASSVNEAGMQPKSNSEAIKKDFPDLTTIEGISNGVNSTIIEINGENIILHREGDISQEDIEKSL